MQDFRNLRVWQAAHRFTLSVYRATEAFPARERYGLAAQLRRAASSIGANLAEGCGRGSDADARRFFQIAMGSSCESLNHLLLARDLGFIGVTIFDALETELAPVRKMLASLIASTRIDSAGSRDDE